MRVRVRCWRYGGSTVPMVGRMEFGEVRVVELSEEDLARLAAQLLDAGVSLSHAPEGKVPMVEAKAVLGA